MSEPVNEEIIRVMTKMDNCYDDVTGEWLDPQLVHEGCMDDMKRFKQMGVYERVPRDEALRDPAMKLIGVRWVKVNKGTMENPKVRCRLVAQEDATTKEDDLFAGTPPLLALRLLLSDVASVQPGSKVVMSMDVKWAFLYGLAKRQLCIELPLEDSLHDQGTHVGVLKRSMYGTRDAPQVWQEEVEKVMTGLQFPSSILYPSLYRCSKRSLLIIAHVDEFLCTGPEEEPFFSRQELGKKFELKSGCLAG